MITRRRLLGAAALPLAAAPLPTRRTIPAPSPASISLLVGAALGSPEDRAARAFAPFLARHLPAVPIALVNLPGDGGLAACHAVADAAPDGATLLWAATPALPAQCLDRGEAGLLDRIAFLAAVRQEPVAFVAPISSRLASTRAMLGAADLRGTALPLATPEAGSPAHLAALQLQELGKTPLAIVAFPSAFAARQAVLAGTACAGALALSDAIDDLREGRLLGLGITAAVRSAVFPDIPPMADAGLPLSVAILHGLAAPPGLPDATVRRLANSLQAVATDPEFRAEADANGFQVAWIDQDSWTETARSERNNLAALWPPGGRPTASVVRQGD